MTPADLVQATQAHGMPAIGLTDHNLLTGAIEFFTICKQNGIQPVIGLEVDLGHTPLNLLATSLEGWSNLCRLSSVLALRDDPEEILGLTKMNWNNTQFDGGEPITLRAAKQVGSILKYLDSEYEPYYRYYM